MKQVLLMCAWGLLICGAQAEPPEVNSQPADEFVFAGEVVIFNVAATNPATTDMTDLTCQWKEFVDGVNDPNPATTDTLTATGQHR